MRYTFSIFIVAVLSVALGAIPSCGLYDHVSDCSWLTHTAGAKWEYCNVDAASLLGPSAGPQVAALPEAISARACGIMLCRATHVDAVLFAKSVVAPTSQSVTTCLALADSKAEADAVVSNVGFVALQPPGACPKADLVCRQAFEACVFTGFLPAPQGTCCDGLECSLTNISATSTVLCCVSLGGACSDDLDCCPSAACASGKCGQCVPGDGTGLDGDPCTTGSDCFTCSCALALGQCVGPTTCGEAGDVCGLNGEPDCCPGYECSLSICELGPGN